MISFFLISLPIFAVIGVGWAATRTRLVAQGALDALNAFSFRFALPALLLRLIAEQPLRQSFNPEFYTGYLASGAIIFVLVLGTSRVVAARDLSTAAVGFPPAIGWSLLARLNVVAGATDASRAMLFASCRKIELLTAIFAFL